MSDLLAVTLGNSTVALARVAEGRITRVERVPVDVLEDLREHFAPPDGAEAGQGAPIIVSSVNPPALRRLAALAAGAVRGPLLVAGTDFPIPIATDVERPDHVGADRLLGALAAYCRVGGACVVVDVGTAITVNAVRGDGVFLGGSIFPGLHLMGCVLAGGTALLPSIDLPSDAPPIGRSTEQAIAAGLLYGAVGAVAALVAGARRALGETAPGLLTGGGGPHLSAHLPEDCRRDFPDLVLEGLVIAYREQAKR